MPCGWQLTFTIAELSYRFVETPIRAGALGRVWELLRETHRPFLTRPWWQWTGVAGAVLVTFCVLGQSVASAHSPPLPSYLSAGAVDIISRPDPTSVGPTFVPPSATPAAPSPNAAPPQNAQGRQQQPPLPSAVATARPQPTPAAAAAVAPAVHVTAVGDSVMLVPPTSSRRPSATSRSMRKVGRQVSAAIEPPAGRRDAGRLGEVVVIDLGNNGTFSAGQFDEIMQVLAGARRVVFVNLKVPRDWEGPNNAVLAESDTLPERRRSSTGTPRASTSPTLLGRRNHLRPEGAQVYAQLIATCVRPP